MPSSTPKSYLAIAAFSLLSLAPVLSAATLNKESLEKLTKSINLECEAKKLPTRDFAPWFALLDQGDYVGLKKQISYVGSTPEAIQVIAAIDKILKANEKDAIKQVEASYTATIKQVTTAIETAKKPVDLDKSLLALSTAKAGLTQLRADHTNQKLYRYVQEIEQKYRSATQIVASWQDYLTYLAAGNFSSAKSCLNSVTSKLTTFPIIPRSKVLHLREGLSTANNSSVTSKPVSELAKITLDFANGQDPQKTYQRLNDATFDQYNRKEADKLMVTLSPLIELSNKATSQSVSELVKNYKDSLRQKTRTSQRINKLYTSHLLTALEKEVNYPNNKHATSPIQYLEDTLEYFIKEQSWESAQQSLGYLTALAQSSHSTKTRNLENALKYIKNGDDCLQADLWIDAIKNYRNGIRNSVQRLPASTFAQKLAEMQKTDEQRYSKASELVDDLMLQDNHRNVAGTIWRLNQYILSSHNPNRKSQAPIPPSLQEVIEKFVELEVEKQLTLQQESTPKK